MADSDPRPTAGNAQDGGFEANLQWLLKSWYKPVEPRAEFRDSLFERLKERQRALALARRSKIRRLAFGSAVSLAASVALLIAVYPAFNSGKPGAASAFAGGGSAQAATAMAHAHDVPAAPATFDSAAFAAPTAAPVIPAANVVNVANVASVADEPEAWQGRVEGRVEAKVAGKDWQRVALIAAGSPIELRAESEQAGVELAPGVRVVMEKGSRLRFDGSELSVSQGLLSLRLLAHAQPLSVNLDGQRLTVQPDSWLGMELKDSSAYAAGGRPAPDVALLSGNAVLASSGKDNPLLAGRAYQLFRYPNFSALQGREMDAQDLSRNTNWVKPTLVNLQFVPAPGR